MNPNRRANLQRKLTLTPVPKPPAGLADKIKGEIPKHLLLDTERERERLSQSVAFNMRVAASILILVSSVYLGLQLIVRKSEERAPSLTAARQTKKATPAVSRADKAKNVDVLTESERPEAKVAVAQTKPNRERGFVDEKRDVARREAKEEAPVAALAPPPAAPAAPAPTPAVATEPAAMADAQNSNRAVGGLGSTKAASMQKLAPTSNFGVESDQQEYNRMVAALDRGERPENVSVAALVQHFAAPAAVPGNAVGLEAEVTASPFAQRKQFLRVSLDVAAPISDASLDISFKDNELTRRAPAGQSHGRAVSMKANSSITLLQEFEPRPHVELSPVANVRLAYRSVDGDRRTIAKEVTAADFRAWSDASLRMKSAVLAALLGDALRNGGDTSRIAAEARDAGLKELAALAERARR
jgi:hypothetical protein